MFQFRQTHLSQISNPILSKLVRGSDHLMNKQTELNIFKGQRGGRRPGAGRKRKHSRGVAHRVRERVLQRHALHVNFKYKTLIRHKRGLQILKRAIINAREKGLKIVHFSMQTNHIHLILEAQDNAALTRGMRSLTVTFAKGMGRGRIQVARYHLHVLKHLREARNALHYVLFNEQKHRGLKKAYINEYCSLGDIKDLKKLAHDAKMLIYQTGIKAGINLDRPKCWLLTTLLPPTPRHVDH